MSAQNSRKASQDSEFKDETHSLHKAQAPSVPTDDTGFRQLLAEMKNIQLEMPKMELRLAEKINTATTSFTKEINNAETRLTENANGMEKQLTKDEGKK